MHNLFWFVILIFSFPVFGVTHYEVLGVNPDSTEEDIKKAYRTQTVKYHPDKNSSPQALEKMKTINTAYDTLSDPHKRAQYDVTINIQNDFTINIQNSISSLNYIISKLDSVIERMLINRTSKKPSNDPRKTNPLGDFNLPYEGLLKTTADSDYYQRNAYIVLEHHSGVSKSKMNSLSTLDRAYQIALNRAEGHTGLYQLAIIQDVNLAYWVAKQDFHQVKHHSDIQQRRKNHDIQKLVYDLLRMFDEIPRGYLTVKSRRWIRRMERIKKKINSWQKQTVDKASFICSKAFKS